MSFNSRFVDLTGSSFGMLSVLSFYGKDKYSHNLWLCRCECGNTTIAETRALKMGKTRSCGCLARKLTVERNTTHKGTHTRLYGIYNKIKWRCEYPNCRDFKNYGGRGIRVCDEWLNSFETFRDWALANGYRDDLTIDRIDVNGNYEPSNCRWVTMKVQTQNRRNSILITFNGETRPLSVWAKEKGIKYLTAYNRYKKGLTPEEILG